MERTPTRMAVDCIMQVPTNLSLMDSLPASSGWCCSVRADGWLPGWMDGWMNQ